MRSELGLDPQDELGLDPQDELGLDPRDELGLDPQDELGLGWRVGVFLERGDQTPFPSPRAFAASRAVGGKKPFAPPVLGIPSYSGALRWWGAACWPDADTGTRS